MFDLHHVRFAKIFHSNDSSTQSKRFHMVVFIEAASDLVCCV